MFKHNFIVHIMCAQVKKIKDLFYCINNSKLSMLEKMRIVISFNLQVVEYRLIHIKWLQDFCHIEPFRIPQSTNQSNTKTELSSKQNATSKILNPNYSPKNVTCSSAKMSKEAKP